MAKKNQYTCIMKFNDANMPSMRDTAGSEDAALATIRHWSKQFAGISSLAYYTPAGDKVCFDCFGTYWFTVPATACESFGLHA